MSGTEQGVFSGEREKNMYKDLEQREDMTPMENSGLQRGSGQEVVRWKKKQGANYESLGMFC